MPGPVRVDVQASPVELAQQKPTLTNEIASAMQADVTAGQVPRGFVQHTLTSQDAPAQQASSIPALQTHLTPSVPDEQIARDSVNHTRSSLGASALHAQRVPALQTSFGSAAHPFPIVFLKNYCQQIIYCLQKFKLSTKLNFELEIKNECRIY